MNAHFYGEIEDSNLLFTEEAPRTGRGSNSSNYNIKFGNRLNRLFIGDVIWLYFFERMGIFKILGGILDDYANNGKYPIPSNDITSLIIEMMVRDIKKGTASTIKDRAYTYEELWVGNLLHKLLK